MIALIDGDILVYRCGFATQSNRYVATTEDGEFIVAAHNKKELEEYLGDTDNIIITKEIIPEPLRNATHNVKQTLASIVHATGADEYKVFITGDGNFREDIATIRPYKGNRDRDSRPYHYKALRKYILDLPQGVLVEGQEADDAMGIEQYKDYMSSYKKVMELEFENKDKSTLNTTICTIDKDLKMIPGHHYNWVTKKKEFINDADAIRFFYTQLITGDTTDNIVGIYGKGIQAANKILQGLSTEEEYLRAVALAYAVSDYEDPEEAMIENGRLLWIRREEGELWQIKESK